MLLTANEEHTVEYINRQAKSAFEHHGGDPTNPPDVFHVASGSLALIDLIHRIKDRTTPLPEGSVDVLRQLYDANVEYEQPTISGTQCNVCNTIIFSANGDSWGHEEGCAYQFLKDLFEDE